MGLWLVGVEIEKEIEGAEGRMGEVFDIAKAGGTVGEFAKPLHEDMLNRQDCNDHREEDTVTSQAVELVNRGEIKWSFLLREGVVKFAKSSTRPQEGLIANWVTHAQRVFVENIDEVPFDLRTSARERARRVAKTKEGVEVGG